MINAAVIGLGRWGKSLVSAVQGKSTRLRFIHGVSKEPDDVRAFAQQHGFRLTTELADAIDNPGRAGDLPGDAAFAACRAGQRSGPRRQAGVVREAAGADARRGGALGRGLPQGRRGARQRQQQALLRVDARIEGAGRRRHARRHPPCRGAFLQRPLDPRRRRLARRSARVARPRHDRRRSARPRRAREHGRPDPAGSTPRRSRRNRSPDPRDVVAVLVEFASGATGQMATIRATVPFWRIHVFGTKGFAEARDEDMLRVGYIGQPPEERTFEHVDSLKVLVEFLRRCGRGPRAVPGLARTRCSI